MEEFKQKKKFRDIFYSWPVILIIFTAVSWLSTAALEEYMIAREAKEDRAEVEKELAETEKRKKAFELKIEEIESAGGLEKILRERFNAKKPGEEVIVIVKEEDKRKDGEEDTDGFLSNLWSAVKDAF